jgi:hypothetical protein
MGCGETLETGRITIRIIPCQVSQSAKQRSYSAIIVVQSRPDLSCCSAVSLGQSVGNAKRRDLGEPTLIWARGPPFQHLANEAWSVAAGVNIS